MTTLYEGEAIPLWYKNHVEAVYVLDGELQISWVHEDGVTPQAQTLYRGDMYLLDQHDRHELLPLETTTVACVFNPPVTGTEDHDADGSYELAPEQDTVTVHRLRYEELKRVEGLFYQGYRDTERQVTISRERYEELTGYESEINEPGYQ